MRENIEPNVDLNEIDETQTGVFVPETPAEPEPVVIPTGVVANCKKLNIRKTPTKAGEIVTVVAAGTKLIIDENKSNAAWFLVHTDGGVDGFCMKEFVNLNK